MFEARKGSFGHMKLDGSRTDDEPKDESGYAEDNNNGYDNFDKEAEEAAATAAAVPTSVEVAFGSRRWD